MIGPHVSILFPFHNISLSTQDVLHLVDQVMDQLATNLKRIQALGIKKVAVAALQPLECLPRVTASNSYQHCDNDSDNIATLVNHHNDALSAAVGELNNATTSNTFVILDLYKAFKDVLQGKGLVSYTQIYGLPPLILNHWLTISIFVYDGVPILNHWLTITIFVYDRVRTPIPGSTSRMLLGKKQRQLLRGCRQEMDAAVHALPCPAKVILLGHDSSDDVRLGGRIRTTSANP